jgi:hypothetical protein
MKRTLVCLALIAPLAAHAQEEPSECTTTTTVHCTGAAAKYAVPPFSQPQPIVQPAPQPPPPPVIPPPAYYPPPQPYYPNVVMLDLRRLESDGWKLVQHSDGSYWRERRVSTASSGVWGTGLAIFAVSWLGTGIGSVATDSGVGPLGFLPVFGAFGAATSESTKSDCSYTTGYYDYGYQSCSDHKGQVAGYVIGGLAQAAGFTMFLVGLASGPKKLERQQVFVAPGMVGSGGGLNAVGQF